MTLWKLQGENWRNKLNKPDIGNYQQTMFIINTLLVLTANMKKQRKSIRYI